MVTMQICLLSGDLNVMAVKAALATINLIRDSKNQCTVVCMLVGIKSFPRFWRNYPHSRNKWYLIWTSCLFSLRWSKKKLFFLKKRNQNGHSKNLIFQLRQFLIFFMKISWIGPWVSRIDWCEGYWCGSIYMVVRLSEISSKTA